MCVKQSYLMLSLLIPNEKGPRNNIDLYLQPLIKELTELWEVGINTYNASTKKVFWLHATIMQTVNDFSAYGNLSG